MRVLDVTMRKEAHPNSGGDHNHEARDPHRREAFGHDGGGTIKRAAAEPENAEYQSQDDGLFHLQAFE